MQSEDKIRVGISACLLGERVRYDGGHKLNNYLKDILGEHIEWVTVCPEVEAGLPVPREAMRLIGDPASPRLVTIKTGVDLTDRLQLWSEKWLRELQTADLRGFVFKSGSPSCGVKGVEVFTASGQQNSSGTGIFCTAFMTRFPLVPVEDERSFRDAKLLEKFCDRLGFFR
ncbi:MAG: DUF523 domain-containing protein [Nitrospirae bacterium]|nr:DUF523 domain-containing protein [Nitrospirota bacterium]